MTEHLRSRRSEDQVGGVAAEHHGVDAVTVSRAADRAVDRPGAAGPGQPAHRLALHAAALLFGLALLVALGGPRTAISSDEGAGIHQAVLLQRGGWLLRPTLPELDPELIRQPFYRADGGPQGRAPYAKHPAYPLLLEGVMRAWWPHGLVVPGILGTWVAAVAAGLLAAVLRSRIAVPTLWLVGLGSPLMIDAHMVLAHAPAAGTAAVAALAAAAVIAPDAFGRRAAHGWAPFAAGAVAVVAAAATVALRSEGLLLVGGLVIGVLAAGSSWRRSVPLAAALAAGAVGVRLCEVAVIRSIVGEASGAPSAPSSSTGFLAARIQAFQASWLDVGYFDRRAEPLLAVGACALVLAVLGSRAGVWPAVVRGLAAIAVGGTLGWLLVGDTGLVPGLLPATPWLLGGLASVRLSAALRAGLPRFLAVASATAAAAILATQYSFGGGVEWGGRFYAIVLPLAAPVLVTALWPTSPRWWRSGPPPIALVVVMVTALVSVGGLVAVRSSHGKTAALAREVAAAARAAPSGRPEDPDRRPVVVARQRLWPQLLWPHLDRYRWVTIDRERLPCALYDLQAAGFERIVLLDPVPDDLVDLAEPRGWRPVNAPTGQHTRVVQADGSRPVAPPTCPPGIGGV